VACAGVGWLVVAGAGNVRVSGEVDDADASGMMGSMNSARARVRNGFNFVFCSSLMPMGMGRI